MATTAPEPTSRKTITLPDRLWQQIAEYRFSRHISSETAAIRRLIQAGLEAENRSAPRTVRRR